MKCTNCNTVLMEEALFCHKCGGKVEKVCGSCGKKIVEEASFCAYCGAQVITVEKDEYDDFDWKETEDLVFAHELINHSHQLSETVDKDWFANDKSVYIELGNPRLQKDHGHIIYKEKIYFISHSNPTEIWRKRPGGGELERIAIRDQKDENIYIGVNRRGIFTYDKHDSFYVYNYTFEGELINRVKLNVEKEQYIKDLFIFDDRIYYISSSETDYPEEKLMSIDIDGNNPIVIYKSIKRTQIHKILASQGYAVFEISFHDYRYESKSGWYMYDLQTREVVNLNSRILPPDLLLTHPEKFDESSTSYIEDNDLVEIFGFDLVNNIMWTFVSYKEIKELSLDIRKAQGMVVQRKVGIGPKQTILNKKEIMIIPERFASYLFNGDYLYHVDSNNEMFGIEPNGSKSENWGSGIHGRCDYLQLTGNYIIGDLFAEYKDYCYPLRFHPPESSDMIPCEWDTKE